MKKIVYIMMGLFLVIASNSCKRAADLDGGLLNNLDANQGGITGPRFMYREDTSTGTEAQYYYNGLKLATVYGSNGNTTSSLTYTSDILSKIEYVGVIGKDKVTSTQIFNYDPTGKRLNSITETKNIFPNYATTPPGTPQYFKSMYKLKYKTNGKLDELVVETGEVLSGTTFAYTAYDKGTYTFNASGNVTQVVKEYGKINANGSYAAPSLKRTYYYSNYDVMKNPHYNLLEFAYMIPRVVEDPVRNMWFSLNNPKDILVTTALTPLPTSYSTTYTYDPQGYPLTGFGYTYDYRKF